MRLRTLLAALLLFVLGIGAGGAMVLAYQELRPGPAAAQADATRPRLLAREASGVDAGVAAVYQQVGPAVVNITSRSVAASPRFGPQLPEEGTGSGVVIDDRGYILTNNHVVADADALEVTFADEATAPAQVVGRDPGNDLAVIKVDVPKEKLRVATFGSSASLRVGEPVVAVGYPFGLDQTATHGIVSGTGRRLARSGLRGLSNLVQTDAAVNPGNSGGPLLNLRGEVIGINTAIENPTGERVFVGVGFAVPIDTASRFLPDMLAGKTIKHAWLGIAGLQLTPERAKELGLDVSEGVLIMQVVPNSPAAAAGLRGGQVAASPAPGRRNGPPPTPTGGDIVSAVDGQPVRRVEDLADYVDTKNVGDTVTLTILRDGQPLTLDVRLGAWPDESANRA